MEDEIRTQDRGYVPKDLLAASCWLAVGKRVWNMGLHRCTSNHRFRTVYLSGLTAAVFVLMVSTTVGTQQASTTKLSEPEYMEIKYSADVTSYRWESQDEILILKGNVKFAQGNMTLLADRVEYRKSNQTAIASGNLKITDDQTTITAESCIVNFKDKKGTLSGNVRMVSKPKPKDSENADNTSLKSQWKDEIIITCQKVDYDYKLKKAAIPGPLSINQKDRTLTADSGTYFVAEERALLVGNVVGKDEKEKHTFAGQKVAVSLKAGDEWIEVEKASGTFYVKEEQESKVEEQPAQQSTESVGKER